MKGNCMICNSVSDIERYSDGDSYIIDCERCGCFRITTDAVTYFERNNKENWPSRISYWIRQHQIKNKEDWVDIDIKLLRGLVDKIYLPSPREQANKLLQWIGDQLKRPDDEIKVFLNSLISVIGAYDSHGVGYIYHYLKDEGVFNSASLLDTEKGAHLSATLSFKGWDKFYELQRSNKESRFAFMAMQYDNKILQGIYSNIIINAVKETGHDIRKLEDIKRAGSIDDKLRVEIRRSKFMIADLTDENRGAYWESGFAEGLGIPVIYICEVDKFKKLQTHFDTNHHLTVLWNNDPETLSKFADDLKATIRESLIGY